MLKQSTKNLIHRFNERIYLKSSIWLLSEKIVRLVVTLFTSILVARYLGPSLLGSLNYSIALIGILYPLIDFGLNSIIVKEFNNKYVNENATLSGAILIKLIVGLICIIVLNGYIFLFVSLEQQTKLLINIVSLSLLFRVNNVFDYWFEAKVQGKYPAKNKAISLIVISIMKIIGILLGASVYIFAIIFVFEYVIQLLGIIYLYRRVNIGLKLIIQLKNITNLIKKSWLLIFSGIATVLYLKIDQVMLGIMSNNVEVGIYSVAAKLSETWYFIPITISSALFPKLIKFKQISEDQYYKEILRILNIFFIISFTISIFITLLSQVIINLLYGSEYILASKILSIHIWASIFVFPGSILSKWLVVENRLSLSLVRQISGAILNIILNFILIPKYAALGAAISTLISYSIANYWITLFNKNTFRMFIIISKSYFSPFSLLYKFIFRVRR